jgi:hypothetical protein
MLAFLKKRWLTQALFHFYETTCPLSFDREKAQSRNQFLYVLPLQLFLETSYESQSPKGEPASTRTRIKNAFVRDVQKHKSGADRPSPRTRWFTRNPKRKRHISMSTLPNQNISPPEARFIVNRHRRFSQLVVYINMKSADDDQKAQKPAEC